VTPQSVVSPGPLSRPVGIHEGQWLSLLALNWESCQFSVAPVSDQPSPSAIRELSQTGSIVLRRLRSYSIIRIVMLA